MNSASDELAELRRMCSASRLDLFVFIRELEKLDMPSLRMEVDRKPANRHSVASLATSSARGCRSFLPHCGQGTPTRMESKAVPVGAARFRGSKNG